ncbi:MAG: undecaprenyl/decaprenyl-phosphate alpha-N-acetylglucosaminyl 1-phosphate transferase [Propionibacteriaceae bacterium]|jgi:UDP-GlcNAc:undecaprenyl-phosphate GlcNAc-1-phosphate transferase|nr:undecaprenyl/decaprenyl-phosphate alpha-N-acetylglucosaminyl 1-phosphate transferase [Propionibacteriaceae bacterium]
MREYLLIAFTSIAVTYLLAGLARRLAFRFNAVAMPRKRDVHTRPIPYFGGLAMLFGVAAGFNLAVHLPWLSSFALVTHDALAIVLGAIVICVVGLIDDVVELGALAKIAGQLLAAGVMVLFGVRLFWLPIPGIAFGMDTSLSIFFTVFIVLLCTNAVNLVDGLDGLASGIVAIGSAAFFTYAYILSYEYEIARATTASVITIVTMGVCIGFLPWNVHRARMFMGDSGSLLLGYLMAASMISFTGQLDPSQITRTGTGMLSTYLPLLVPVGAMALPLLDLVLAYVRRTVKGKLWFEADKEHLHHRILRLGHGQLGAVNLMWLWAAIGSFGVVAAGLFPSPWTFAGIAAAIALAAYLTWGRRHRANRAGKK